MSIDRNNEQEFEALIEAIQNTFQTFNGAPLARGRIVDFIDAADANCLDLRVVDEV